GAYSDKVAHAFGVGLNYKAIPFKGIYKKLRPEKSYLVKGNIYPVPDIRNPFLGVHFTRSVKGDVYLGPTAIPALGRENYGILKGIDLEAIDISLREAVLFFVNPKFREVALTEPRKYIFKYFFEDARKLVKELNPEDIIPSDKVGIRPQLVDWDKKELVMDFMVVRDGGSVHILNSISPAFTSSMEFARFVVDKYIRGQD
ncbi:MAG: FAD-dependent oxidoreductase, partial [Deltaproteobacteria bacterium]